MSSFPVVFTATIFRNQGMDAAFVEFPHNMPEVFGTTGSVKVKAVFDNAIHYRGSLVKMGHSCHILGITREIRNKLKKSFGDPVLVSLEPDFEERTVELPDDLAKLLQHDSYTSAFYKTLSYTHKKEYINWITSARKVETRQKRVALFLDKLRQHQKLKHEQNKL